MAELLLTGPIEQGLLYAVMVLGVYLTFRILHFPDLTVDGSFTLGAAVAAILIFNGVDPFVATAAAVVAGFVAGACTGFLHAQMRISDLLAGILTMTALYSVNLRVMGRPNVPLLRIETLFTKWESWGVVEHLFGPYAKLAFLVLVVAATSVLMAALLHTDWGIALRATGDNERMAGSQGLHVGMMKLWGLALSNSVVAFCGALVAQYQGFADVGMGIGMIIVGLASVIAGQVIVRPITVTRAIVGVLLGSLIYRAAIFFAIRAGLSPTDLKIATAVLVVLALSAPVLKDAAAKGLNRFSMRFSNGGKGDRHDDARNRTTA